MGRSPCCDENGLKKGPWTPEEDQKLVQYIEKQGHGSWRALPKLAGLNRCGKSCRLRWSNYLRPDIKRGKFSQEEEQTILNLHSVLGNKWSAIATHLPGRTDNEIKNFWNTNLKKKLIQMGFDPMTHRPRTDLFSSFNQLIALANLKELMDHQPWEDVHSMRLQAEAAQLAKIQCLQYLLQQTTASMTTNPNMDVLNLIKDNSILTSSQQLDIPTSYSLGDLNDSIMFPHLPNLQNPYSFQTSMNGELCQGYNNSTVIHQEGITPQSPWGSLSPSPVTDNNLAEACSSSCYEGGASSFWPELLLDDPGFMNEMA